MGKKGVGILNDRHVNLEINVRIWVKKRSANYQACKSGNKCKTMGKEREIRMSGMVIWRQM